MNGLIMFGRWELNRVLREIFKNKINITQKTKNKNWYYKLHKTSPQSTKVIEGIAGYNGTDTLVLPSFSGK